MRTARRAISSGTSRSSWSGRMARWPSGSGRAWCLTRLRCWPPSRPTSRRVTSSARPPLQSSGEGGGGALDHLAGDDHALDLAGALPDAFDAQLAVEAFGDVLAHVAAAAEDLDGAVGDAAGHLRAVQLGHRALGVRHLVCLAACGGGVRLAARGGGA